MTKSGTNNLHGDVRLEYQPSAFQADSNDPNLQYHTNRFRPGVGVGGPLIRDHLFAYGSLNFYRVSQTDQVNDFGPIPDSDLNINEYFLKLSGQPSSNQLIDASFRYRGIDQTYADIGSSDAATTGDNPKEIDRVGVFSWFWTVNPALNLEFKYNYDDYPAGASPVTPLPYQPPFNAADPASVGNYCVNDVCTGTASLFSNDDNFQRQEFKFGTTYLAQGLGASHQIKVGATYSANREDLKRVANGWGAITQTTSSNCGTDANGDDLTCYRARFSPLQPAQVSKAHTIGVYLQDQATWNRLTVNLGVLVNQDTFIPNGDGQFVFVQGDYTLPNSELLPCTDPNANPNGCTYQDTLTIPFSKQWQPRVGIAYETNDNDPRQGLHQLRALRQHGQPVDRPLGVAVPALPHGRLLRSRDRREGLRDDPLEPAGQAGPRQHRSHVHRRVHARVRAPSRLRLVRGDLRKLPLHEGRHRGLPGHGSAGQSGQLPVRQHPGLAQVPGDDDPGSEGLRLQLDAGRVLYAVTPRRKLGPRLRHPALLLVLLPRRTDPAST